MKPLLSKVKADIDAHPVAAVVGLGGLTVALLTFLLNMWADLYPPEEDRVAQAGNSQVIIYIGDEEALRKLLPIDLLPPSKSLQGGEYIENTQEQGAFSMGSDVNLTLIGCDSTSKEAAGITDASPTDVLPISSISGLEQSELNPLLRGVGGFSLALYLTAIYSDHLIKIRSKINEFLFLSGNLSGNIVVETTIDFFETPDKCRRHEPYRTEIYIWHIHVQEDGYRVLERIDDSMNPFPGLSLDLPNSAIDPSNPNSIWGRQLDHALYVQGNNLIARDIYRKINDHNFERIPNNHAFYSASQSSCIILLSRGYPSERNMEEFNTPLWGRCDHPSIMMALWEAG
jgi:hypothetical protein